MYKKYIEIKKGINNVGSHVLHNFGVLKFIIPDTINHSNSGIYAKGSLLQGKLVNGKTIHGNLFSLYICNIPCGSYDSLFFSPLNNDFVPQMVRNSFVVEANDTCVIEAFIKWKWYYSGNSPLKTNTVYSMTIDSKGVKWFGTAKGLYNFDGNVWDTCFLFNEQLEGNRIFTVEAGENDLWIGTEKGVARIADNILMMYTSIPDYDIPIGIVHEIMYSPKRGTWIGTNSGAINVTYESHLQWHEPIHMYSMNVMIIFMHFVQIQIILYG